ncbi:MAG: hypothetical protein ACJ79H_04385 [Myxococcales bacterium]
MQWDGPRQPEPPPEPEPLERVILSLAIQAHPARSELVTLLMRKLPGVDVVFDPEPDGFPSPWRTYRLALERTPPEATHRLVVQDDVVLCEGFVPAARHAARLRPDDVLVLWHGGQPRENLPALRAAGQTGSPFAPLSRARWVPAIANIWPVPVLRAFLAWAEEQGFPERLRADDEIIGRGLRGLGLQAYAVVPSLVEHPDVVPSLLGRRARAGHDKGRVAAVYTGCPPDGWPLS